MRNPLAPRYKRAREAGRNTLLDAETKTLYALLAGDSSPQAALVELYLCTGCRNSEGHAIARENLDTEYGTVMFDTLKQQQADGVVISREIPIPKRLVQKLYNLNPNSSDICKLWSINRQTAWRWTHHYMTKAGIPSKLANPLTLRHSYNHRGIVGIINKQGEKETVEKRIREYLMGHRRSSREQTVNDIYAFIQGHEHRYEAKIMGGWTD